VGRVSAIAAPQHGLVTIGQLDRCAGSRAAWRRLVRAGWLRPEVPRVYAVAGAPASWHRQLRAGLLSLGPAAAVSHRAAAALHGFDRAHPGAVEFTLPRASRGRAVPFTVHTSGFLGRSDVLTVHGHRVTSATRTVIDLARLRVPPGEVEAAIDSAVRLQLSSPIVLEKRLGELRGRGRWGCRLLDALLLDSGGHTMLERRFLRLVRTAGLPRPRTQVVQRQGSRTVARVDFLYDEFRLVVEVSGKLGHSSPAERSKDARRRNELQELGWVVYEYTWHHVNHETDYVRRTLTARLTGAGWTP
jgi:very-short-patch-repair endonuclease